MKVCFVLPGPGNIPVGGVKIVYEYANGLVRRGYDVVIIHPAMLLKGASLWARVRFLASYLKRLIGQSYKPGNWFTLDSRVQLRWTPSLHPRHIPTADVVVATAWQTAEWIAEYPEAKGRPLYLIQGLETWEAPEERVLATWRLPLQKIVVAQWLRQIATAMGEAATYIPNGLDFDALGVDTPPHERQSERVLMLYHQAAWKGGADGLEAITLAKARLPQLEIQLFGVHQRPRTLPQWAGYVRTPSPSKLRRLYNRAAVFVSPSQTEGWGLTASEALMCGCALAVTDTGGHREFAFPEVTALVSPVGDPQALSDNIVRLVCNRDLRLDLAAAGHRFIQQFTWTRALDEFERIILQSSPGELPERSPSSAR